MSLSGILFCFKRMTDIQHTIRSDTQMKIKKLKIDDVISLSGCDWKAIDSYITYETGMFYKDRLKLMNLKTGETIDCANSFS